MGTRADFYVGIREPEYVGSLTQDGHPWNIDLHVLIQVNPVEYEEVVHELIERKNGVDKWSWPWEDSQLTDYSYFLSKAYGKVFAYSMKEKIMFDPLKIAQGEDLNTAKVDIDVTFPKMGRAYGPKAA